MEECGGSSLISNNISILFGRKKCLEDLQEPHRSPGSHRVSGGSAETACRGAAASLGLGEGWRLQPFSWTQQEAPEQTLLLSARVGRHCRKHRGETQPIGDGNPASPQNDVPTGRGEIKTWLFWTPVSGPHAPFNHWSWLRTDRFKTILLQARISLY